MAWPAVVGAVAGALAPIAGDIYSTRQNQNFQDHWNRVSIDEAEKYAKNSIQYRVADAKRAGIHPLAALGINPAQGPVLNSNPPGHNLGDAMGRSVGQLLDMADRVKLKAELKREEAYTRNIDADTEVKKAQLRQILGQRPVPSFNDGEYSSVVAGSDDLVRVDQASITASDFAGHDAGIDNMEKVAVNRHGSIYEAPTQEIQESVSEEITNQVRYGMGKAVDYAAGQLAFRASNTKKAKQWVNEQKPYLARLREKLVKKFGEKYMADKVVRYNPYRGMPVIQNVKDVQDEFFSHKPIISPIAYGAKKLKNYLTKPRDKYYSGDNNDIGGP